MNVRDSLLSILSIADCYGYQLKHEYTKRTKKTDLNPGQVYSTLHRATKSGLVERLTVDQAGHERYRLTKKGKKVAESWLTDPGELTTAGIFSFLEKLRLCCTISLDSSKTLIQNRLALHDKATTELKADHILQELLIAERKIIETINRQIAGENLLPFGISTEQTKRGRKPKTTPQDSKEITP